MNETLQILGVVINTLNQIEVKGEQNLNALLACMQTLDQLCHKLAEGGAEDG